MAKDNETILIEQLLSYGMDKRFLENPAISTVIGEIESKIHMMTIGFDTNYETKKRITSNGIEIGVTIECRGGMGKEYSYKIFCPSPEKIQFTSEEKGEGLRTDGYTYFREVTEKEATLNKNGTLTFIEHHARLQQKDQQLEWECIVPVSERKEYSTNGIMKEHEELSYPSRKVQEQEEIFFEGKRKFRGQHVSLPCETRNFLRREYFDTAVVISENRISGINYRATVPLDQQSGLRDMKTVVGFGNNYPEHIVIEPLSQEEIERTIQKEGNPKVMEELRKLAVGREHYRYDSANDRDFRFEMSTQERRTR